MAEKNWEIFLGLLCESGEETRKSGIYKLMIEKYPIQLMQKLVSTAVDEYLSWKKRESAAAVIQEMNGANLLEKNYSKIDMQTLEFLGRNAINLMISNERTSVLQMCGQQTAFRLVRLSLESEQRWEGFLEFAEEGFTTQSEHLDIFLAIFSRLPSNLLDKLVRNMEACITRNSAQFEATMLHLLHRARHDTPFLFLPCIIYTFKTISPTLTQGAIMSQFFYNHTSYRSRYMSQLHVVEILRHCIEHTRPFQLSTDAVKRMRYIIRGLAQLTDAEEEALRLLQAFKKKYDEYNPPSKCRQPWLE